jgi:hypothetical protein
LELSKVSSRDLLADSSESVRQTTRAVNWKKPRIAQPDDRDGSADLLVHELIDKGIEVSE